MRDAVRVGPHGYEHGWIFVGVPAAGASVYHPQFGRGTVSGHAAGSVSVSFGGRSHSFEHHQRSPTEPEAASAPHLEQRPESLGGEAGVMTAAEAKKWGNANWPGSDKLPPEQYRALVDYSGPAAYQLNRYLRTGKVPDRGAPRSPTPVEKRRLDAEIAAIEKACEDNPTPSRAMVVHRGTGLAEFGNVTPDKLVGQQVREKAFLSTSVGKSLSSMFGKEDVHLAIRVPAGTPAFYLDKVSSHKGERELLLGKGLSYKITSARLVRGQWQVEAEVTLPGRHLARQEALMTMRFNLNHAKAGSSAGGQFTSGGSSSGGSKSGAGKKPDAHQQHVAHMQYLASHPSTPGSRAQQKAALLDQAKADREKAGVLEKQLHGLEQQATKAAATAKHAKAAAAHAKAAPATKRTLVHKAAATARKHASLKSRISGLQQQISDLNAKAKGLEEQAAKL